MISPARLLSRLFLCATVVFASVAAAHAKSYSADRFDSHIRVLPNGSIEVTETIVFRFESGTFREVFRDIPRRRTDRIEVIRGTIDERMLPFGTDPGQLEVSERSKVRVRWHLAQPVSESTHTFTVTYRVDGVVYQTDDGDRFNWRALPGEHNYRIRETAITIEHPVAPSGPPRVKSSRAEQVDVDSGSGLTSVSAQSLRNNGWIEVALTFPAASTITSAPAWQQAERNADALAPRWMIAALIVLGAGLVLWFFMWQRYDKPHRTGTAVETLFSPPDDLKPAIAGSLSSNGRVTLEHAMGAIFNLADRGEIAIREEAKGMFGQRNFILERRRGRALAGHEQAVLDLVFIHKGQQEPTVSLSTARQRLTSGFKRFKTQLIDEMIAASLIDRDRKAMHTQLGVMATVVLVVALVLLGACAALVDQYRGWPLLVPGALVAVAVAGFTMMGATTPLSNEGVRRGERWRAYRRHLKDVAKHEASLASPSPAGVLSLAIALGLASAWAKLLKSTPGLVPAWFHAFASSGDDGAFPAFVAYGGASAASSHGGGGGAAGGGASGAS
jgi:uncharacterized membrane protein YgcG